MIGLMGTCLFTLAWLLLTFGILLRLLPGVLGVARRSLRGLLILSYRLHHLILTRLAPYLNQHLGIDVLTGPSRIAATILLSLALGVPFLLLTRLPLTGLSLGLLFLHGLLIGLGWDEIQAPGGLQLGVKIE